METIIQSISLRCMNISSKIFLNGQGSLAIYKEEDVIGGQSIEYSDPFDIVNDVHHVLSDIAMASGYCSVRLAAYVSNGFKSRMLHKRNGIKTVVTVSHGII